MHTLMPRGTLGPRASNQPEHAWFWTLRGNLGRTCKCHTGTSHKYSWYFSKCKNSGLVSTWTSLDCIWMLAHTKKSYNCQYCTRTVALVAQDFTPRHRSVSPCCFSHASHNFKTECDEGGIKEIHSESKGRGQHLVELPQSFGKKNGQTNNFTLHVAWMMHITWLSEVFSNQRRTENVTPLSFFLSFFFLLHVTDWCFLACCHKRG